MQKNANFLENSLQPTSKVAWWSEGALSKQVLLGQCFALYMFPVFNFLIVQNWLANTFSPSNVQLKVFPNCPDPTIRSCVFSSGYVGLPSFFGDCHLDHQLANFWLALKLVFVSTNALASKLGFCCWVKFERRLFGSQVFFWVLGCVNLNLLCSLCVCTSLISTPVFPYKL